jgi:tetratricopeptide (TPR) repeat protein
MALRRAGRPSEAIAAHQRAVDVKPDYAWAWYNKGKAEADAGRTTAAKASLKKALELDPNLQLAKDLLAKLNKS